MCNFLLAIIDIFFLFPLAAVFCWGIGLPVIAISTIICCCGCCGLCAACVFTGAMTWWMNFPITIARRGCRRCSCSNDESSESSESDDAEDKV